MHFGVFDRAGQVEQSRVQVVVKTKFQQKSKVFVKVENLAFVFCGLFRSGGRAFVRILEKFRSLSRVAYRRFLYDNGNYKSKRIVGVDGCYLVRS